MIEGARTIGAAGLGPWLSDLWEERREALSRALEGQPIDWRRLRTGLVLEWALLAWLEGVQDG
ncbi:MAG: hypothetical protein RML14_06910 [Meiothermus sp.]|uniref:hypothetical protein n=1 Tax=Meiothermus sp. TaxID=1955249 RepID=UPI00298F351B|nr:hypothetical protein [Meiothermus sp.]MDW8481597.1 hypothetical protein [Meiothermus sp.]